MKQKFGTYKSKREEALDEVFDTEVETLGEELYKLRHESTAWRIWAKALGEKAGETDKESDKIAMVRTVIVGVNFITCLFIVSNIIRGWFFV